MKKIIMMGCVFVLASISVSAQAGKWNDYVTVSTEGDVVVSYRQREQKDGWLIEWRVKNNSADWVEPFAKIRTYSCEDGSSTTFAKKSLGPYPPSDQRKGGIRDRRICPGSQMGDVKVEIELRPVAQKIRNMWK